jgi:hypothetical protein
MLEFNPIIKNTILTYIKTNQRVKLYYLFLKRGREEERERGREGERKRGREGERKRGREEERERGREEERKGKDEDTRGETRANISLEVIARSRSDESGNAP